MFIRETLKIDKKASKKYISYQLVGPIRTENGPRQKILLLTHPNVVSNRKNSLQFTE